MAASVAAHLNLGVWPAPSAVVTSAIPWDATLRQQGLRDGSPTVASVCGFTAAADVGSGRLRRAITRYETIISSTAPLASDACVRVAVNVASEDETLVDADVSYSISAGGSDATISANTMYGAMYGMETVAQLVRLHGGLPAVIVTDEPMLNWRGLMIDTGRRFFPVPLVMNILDSMAAAKLNVFHWHLSDNCRWAVQSALFPNVTSRLTGDYGGFYSADDVTTIIGYAADLGIRVVPEFDSPGHSRSLLSLEATGQVEFCAPTWANRSQLFDDPQNVTITTLTALYAEMAGLFPDPVFHIGADETSPRGRCTAESTFALERQLLQSLTSPAVNKTPAGWEEALLVSDVAAPGTILYAWNRDSPAQIIARGHKAIASAGTHWYVVGPPSPPTFPAGWAPFWYDARDGIPAANLSELLGAEASVWTDFYCITDQCGATNNATIPVGAPLFPPRRDAEFGRSIGGLIWPRAFVAAGAFWNYNASVDPSSPDFVASITALNDAVAARGGFVCPSGCFCDELSACGRSYIQGPASSAVRAGVPYYYLAALVMAALSALGLFA